MKTNTIMLSIFLLSTTLAFAQTETGKTNSKEETLKVEKASKVKPTKKEQISKGKGSSKATVSKSGVSEQELIKKRQNLGVIELKNPEEVLTPEK